VSLEDNSFLSVILEIALELPFYGRLVDYVGSGPMIKSLVKSLCLHQVAQAEKCIPSPLASSLPTTVFPTPGVPVTMMILADDCSGAPAGTLRPMEAFEPGSPDRESGILSAMCRPVYTTGADAPRKYVSVKSFLDRI